jgi:hypothetical protein
LIAISIGKPDYQGRWLIPATVSRRPGGAGIDPKKSPATERLSVIVCGDCERAQALGDDRRSFTPFSQQYDKAGRQRARLPGLDG